MPSSQLLHLRPPRPQQYRLTWRGFRGHRENTGLIREVLGQSAQAFLKLGI